MSDHYDGPDNPLLDNLIDFQQRKLIKEEIDTRLIAMIGGQDEWNQMQREFSEQTSKSMEFYRSGKTAKEFFPGPWQEEEDMKEFWIEAPSLFRVRRNRKRRIDRKWLSQYGFTLAPAKFHCLIWRIGEMGNLNGYVGIPPGHLYFFTHLTRKLTQLDVNVYGPDFSVHGGITFGGWGGKTPAPMKKHLYYIGFDTAHAWDLVPGMQMPGGNNTYRNMSYVEKQVRSLATQVINLGLEVDQIENGLSRGKL